MNEVKAAQVYGMYPKATKYKDFRKMLDAEDKNIDAVMIATPDHVHTPTALLCMQRGKHVYCEKPLARTVWEARLLRDAAVKYKVATQMGNQWFSHEGTKTAAEILWSGATGFLDRGIPGRLDCSLPWSSALGAATGQGFPDQRRMRHGGDIRKGWEMKL